MSDPIDDLLERSAPTIVDRASARDAALAQMVADARDTVRPPRRKQFTRRNALIGGAVTALLLGGAGVAAATGLPFPWQQHQLNPYVAVEFTLPSGLACEQRVFVAKESGYQDTGMGDWLRAFASERDLLTLSDVDSYLTMIKSSRSDGEGTPEASADVQYWHAVGTALSQTIFVEAVKAGFDPGELGFQTYCADDQGNAVIPE